MPPEDVLPCIFILKECAWVVGFHGELQPVPCFLASFSKGVFVYSFFYDLAKFVKTHNFARFPVIAGCKEGLEGIYGVNTH